MIHLVLIVMKVILILNVVKNVIHALNFYSDNGKCYIGYVDFSMFQSINIFNIPPPRNNRMIISFWFYINNLIKEHEIIYFSLFYLFFYSF